MRKNKFFRSSFIVLFALLTVGSTRAQLKVDYSKIPDFKTSYRPDYSLNSHVETKSKGLRGQQSRPDHWNNAMLKYFPPIFNQEGPSCMGSSFVGYNFTNEINSLRDKDGSLEENQYAIFFHWLLTNCNSGKEDVLRCNGTPNAPTYGGRTYSSLFGYKDWNSNDFGWMQGYDKWYATMHNRIYYAANFPQDVSSETGREAVKQWVWNHNGDQDYHGGGCCYITVASSLIRGKIASTPTNDAAGVAGKYYVCAWGKSVDHALTIVGYDDRIEFDLDSNGVYGEESKDEKGAWIIMNSWGSWWSNSGSIYCPYKYGGYILHADDGYWTPEIMYVRKQYRPLRTLKVRMDYSRRSEIMLSAGISADTSATAPTMSTAFEHFKYAGDGDGNNTDADTPMLGMWVDGMHYEPMELGYDLTDLSSGFDRTRPLKYFFFIKAKPSAKGQGKIYDCSLIDYEFDRLGIEEPFKIDTVTIANAGKTTMISVIVPGEQINKPRNLTISANKLQWQVPQTSLLPLKGYYIFVGDAIKDSVKADCLTYPISSNDSSFYSVAAEYDNNGSICVSDRSNTVRKYVYQAPATNIIRSFSNSGFTIPGLFSTPLQEATIEFWLKPNSCKNWNQQIGPGWGNFLFHTTDTYQVVVGWNTGTDRFTSTSGVLNLKKWNHIVITIDGHTLMLYVNGLYKGRITSSKYSGLSAFGNFPVGVVNNMMDGAMDELRIWKVARKPADIMGDMRMEIANPQAESDLLAYYKMDVIDHNGITMLRDCAHGHDAYLSDESLTQYSEDNTFLTAHPKLSANFTIPAGPLYAGTPVQLAVKGLSNIIHWVWNAPDAQVKDLEVQTPALIFDKPGTYPVTLTVTDVDGNKLDTTHTVTIEALPQPKADFDVSATSLPAGEHFGFINRSEGVNCSYVWSIPGAEQETVKATNAGATYWGVGNHQVTLTATNAAGSSTITKTIEVSNIAPIVHFNVYPRSIFKGDKIYLQDRSRYQPNEWFWNVENAKHHVGIVGRYSSYTPLAPGYYKVSLMAKNDVGQNTYSEDKAFLVSNADSKNGLHFAGNGERVQMISPITQTSKGWTIDWWMRLDQTGTSRFLTTEDSSFAVTILPSNSIKIDLEGLSTNSPNGFIIPNEWHHYAIVYNQGGVNFYRDAEDSLAASDSIKSITQPWKGHFTIGSQQHPLSACIDEFRIWKKALSLATLASYCNQPIDNPDSARTADQLMVYYSFDQSSGNVTDATSNHNNGIRLGFGPDGDAWNSSLGVFSLDFESAVQPKEVTDNYLTNCHVPFRHTQKDANLYVPLRYFELETGTPESRWIVKNTIHESDTISTGANVDMRTLTYTAEKYHDLLNISSSWDKFCSKLSDFRLYQTVTLPIGCYRFSIDNQYTVSGTSYIVATLGDTLAGNKDLQKSLTYANMINDSYIDFQLTRETKISLGLLVNLSGFNRIIISNFHLYQLPYEQTKGDGLVNIFDAVQRGLQPTFQPEVGGLRIVSEKTIPVKIFTDAGQCVFNEFVSGSKHISLPKGIYIVNGQKLAIVR